MAAPHLVCAGHGAVRRRRRAHAQARARRSTVAEAAVGAGSLGGAGSGAADANLRTRTRADATACSTPIRDRSRRAVARSACWRIALTRRYGVEARFGLYGTGAADRDFRETSRARRTLELAERIDQYLVDGALVVTLPGPNSHRRLVPFVSAGGGLPAAVARRADAGRGRAASITSVAA